MKDTIHFKDITSKKYPMALCGNSSISARSTTTIDEVTCRMCLKAHNKRYVKFEIERSFNKKADA